MMPPAGGSSGYTYWHTTAPTRMEQAAFERQRPATLPDSVTPTAPDALLASLHDALLPSEREEAAEALAAPDKAGDPRAVTALAKAAREDPAVSVRATCVRCLGKMQANTEVVKTTLQALQGDPETEVRQEAEQVLAHLGDAATGPAGGPVQPVGHFAPDGPK
jgi:HEAT repeat protein